MTCRLLPFFFLLGSMARTACGQSIAPEAPADPSVGNAIRLYSQTVMNQSLLFNGEEYFEFPEPYDDYPYFGSEYWEEGSVVYYDQLYENVTMQYDLVRDDLVIEHYGQDGYVAQVKLHKDKVERFEVLGHTFVNIFADDDIMGLRAGFYDQLFNGEVTRLLCKRKKSLEEDASEGVMQVSFSAKESYYMVSKTRSYPVKNKKSVARVFPEYRKKLYQFAQDKKLDFNFHREKALIELLGYLETLAADGQTGLRKD